MSTARPRRSSPSRLRAVAADFGMAEEIAAAVQRDGLAVARRPVRLAQAVLARVLRGLPDHERSVAAARIEKVRRWIRGDHLPAPDGLLESLEDDLHQLDRTARRHPPLAPVVARLERQTVRNELVVLRYDAARALARASKPARLIPAGKDTIDAATAAVINEHCVKMTADPVARAGHNRWGQLSDLVVWTERAVAALDTGQDATHAVAQAYRAKGDLDDANQAALYHYGVELPRRRRRAGGMARAAERRAALEARNEALQRKAKRLRRTGRLSERAIAARLACDPLADGLTKNKRNRERHVRRLIAPAK